MGYPVCAANNTGDLGMLIGDDPFKSAVIVDILSVEKLYDNLIVVTIDIFKYFTTFS